MRLESEINKHIIHKLEQERDMYKRNWDKRLKERDTLNDKLNQAYEDGYQMEGKYRYMKTQRDTLIDDIAVLHANNERLEEELKRRREEEENLEAKLSAQLSMKRDLEKENEQKTKVISLYKKAYEKTHKGWFKYRELTNHIRDMKFASPYSYNYIHLVNFIKELERADDE